jgi:hypothetical protein
MNAYEIAEEWQKKYGEGTLQERIEWNQKFGLVFITPKIFILANEVYYNIEEEDLDMTSANPNAWFIELAASSNPMTPIKEIMRALPSKQEFVIWVKRNVNKLHAYKWDKLARKVGL